MHSITQDIHFCYGHRLVGHAGPCRHLHGHNGKIELTFSSDTLDAQGMVLDFTVVKAKMKKWVDETLDHRMILHRQDPVLAYLQEQGEPIVVTDIPPTAELLAQIIFHQAKNFALPIKRVKVWETHTQSAAYSE